MFSQRNIRRLAGALLVAGIVAFLGHGVTLSTSVSIAIATS